MSNNIVYLILTKDKFSIEEKGQLALLMQKLDEIEYQLPPMPAEYFVRDIDESPMSHQKEIWIIAKHKSEIIGYLRSTWSVENDNLNLAKIRGMIVGEEFQRNGIGRTQFQNI